MQEEIHFEREHLAEAAAGALLRGCGPGAAVARLRLTTTAELLCPTPPPAIAIDLCAELDTLRTVAQRAVRRRAGWLYAAVPADLALPVLVRPRLLQAAVLSVWRNALVQDSPATMLCYQQGGAAVISLRGGQVRQPGSDAVTLLLRLAQEGGGTAVFSGRGRFSAAIRLPMAPGLPLKAAQQADFLLHDRYSLPYLYLSGFCAGPDE